MKRQLRVGIDRKNWGWEEEENAAREAILSTGHWKFLSRAYRLSTRRRGPVIEMTFEEA